MWRHFNDCATTWSSTGCIFEVDMLRSVWMICHIDLFKIYNILQFIAISLLFLTVMFLDIKLPLNSGAIIRNTGLVVFSVDSQERGSWGQVILKENQGGTQEHQESNELHAQWDDVTTTHCYVIRLKYRKRGISQCECQKERYAHGSHFAVFCTSGCNNNVRAPSQYKDRLIYVWRFPC